MIGFEDPKEFRGAELDKGASSASIRSESLPHIPDAEMV